MPLALRDLFRDDLDKVFAFRTKKLVKILDYRLGWLERFFQVLVIAYVIIYVFIMCEGYYMYESGHGNIITYKSGTSYSVIDNGEG